MRQSVSAVIPMFNRREYISRAIDSILAQTAPVDEILIVDDGSTDGSADFVESKYGDRVRVIRQANAGVSGARLRGIQEARGEWIAFLDSDDEWLPERNRRFLEAAERLPADVAWVFGDLEVVRDETATSLYQQRSLPPLTSNPHIFPDSLIVQYPFQFGMLQASFIRRQVLLDLGCFKEGLHHSEDFLAGFQVACKFKVAAIPYAVGKLYRTSDLADSSIMAKGTFGRDYILARIMAFQAAVDSGRTDPWQRMVAEHACWLGTMQADFRLTLEFVMQQLRFGGAKGIAFVVAAMMGRRGRDAWNRLAKARIPHPNL